MNKYDTSKYWGHHARGQDESLRRHFDNLFYDWVSFIFYSTDVELKYDFVNRENKFDMKNMKNSPGKEIWNI